MSTPKIAWTLSLVVLSCGGAAAGGAPAKTDTSSSPGAKLYAAECSGCHGAHGEGRGKTPRLVGEGALPVSRESRGAFENAKQLLDYVSTSMPLPKSRAGSLTKEQYLALVQWLLQGNGRQAPAGGLTEANAASVVVNP